MIIYFDPNILKMLIRVLRSYATRLSVYHTNNK